MSDLSIGGYGGYGAGGRIEFDMFSASPSGIEQTLGVGKKGQAVGKCECACIIIVIVVLYWMIFVFVKWVASYEMFSAASSMNCFFSTFIHYTLFQFFFLSFFSMQ